MDLGSILRRIINALMFVLAAIYGMGMYVDCRLGSKFVPMDVQALKGYGQVHFVSFGDFPSSTLDDLARYYHDKYGLQIQIGQNLPLPESAYNPKRNQYVAERLIATLQTARASAGSQHGEIYIGFTNEDIYIEGYTWAWAFGYRQEGGLAVVSDARMDFPYLGFWPISQEKREARLRKMTSKHIGVLYFRLPQSDHCRSVMYKKILGVQELDIMTEDF